MLSIAIDAIYLRWQKIRLMLYTEDSRKLMLSTKDRRKTRLYTEDSRKITDIY